MFDLNDVAASHAADPHNLRAHIASLPDQLEAGWAAALEVALPESLRGIDRVAITAMGGSALSGSLAAALLAPECRLPMVTVRDADLPAWASGASTLVIAISYSGKTVETLSAFEQARQRGCSLLAITGEGKLRNVAQAVGTPVISIRFESPRGAALGWSLGALLNVATRLGWSHNFTADVQETVSVLRNWCDNLNVDSPVMKNPAKRQAGQLMGRMAVVFGAGLFAEVAQRWKEQINETAKAWAEREVLPDADHHSLAGVEYPDGFTSKIIALFLTGQADPLHNAQRVQLTQQMYLMAGCSTDILLARGDSPLAQALSLVLLGDFVGFYLALLYSVEPARVPAVAEFKMMLAGI